jgi:hypothetical protein
MDVSGHLRGPAALPPIPTGNKVRSAPQSVLDAVVKRKDPALLPGIELRSVLVNWLPKHLQKLKPRHTIGNNSHQILANHQ